ncbi:hypothetical protein ACFYXH_00190 [Streptomyces sp. NPDC002730]|uniref:hypothetical protein n=1 Tax=Streptomyces sp. NPDC002730 TaxID=3364662 RepID=UPI0036B4122D
MTAANWQAGGAGSGPWGIIPGSMGTCSYIVLIALLASHRLTRTIDARQRQVEETQL